MRFLHSKNDDATAKIRLVGKRTYSFQYTAINFVSAFLCFYGDMFIDDVQFVDISLRLVHNKVFYL